MITIYSDLIYPGFPEALVDNPPAFEGLQSPFHETPGPEGKKNLETRRFKGRKKNIFYIYIFFCISV